MSDQAAERVRRRVRAALERFNLRQQVGRRRRRRRRFEPGELDQQAFDFDSSEREGG
jgi:hypothetical protein